MESKRVKELSRLTKEEWREYTKTVWRIANTSHREHPAVFPPEIPTSARQNCFSFWGETVLDPFAGTGTTARVALELGRKAICIEQNSRYVELIYQTCHSIPQPAASRVHLRLFTVTVGVCSLPRIALI